MSSIKTTKIDGDLSLGRNLSIGGKTTIQGNSHFKGGLKIDGWLDAPNIKGANKGLFTSVEKLKAEYPFPRNGWYAFVGTSLPATIYVGDGGNWVDTGGTGGNMTADVQQFHDDLESLQDNFTSELTELDKVYITTLDITTLTNGSAVTSEQQTEVTNIFATNKPVICPTAGLYTKDTEDIWDQYILCEKAGILYAASINGTKWFTYQFDLRNKAFSSGYVECTTLASTAAKTITVTGMSALSTGIRLLVRMTNNNTANSATLNINSLGAKSLYYNGSIVSANNTWDAGAVLDVYYNGAFFQATDFTGQKTTVEGGIEDVPVYQDYRRTAFFERRNGGWHVRNYYAGGDLGLIQSASDSTNLNNALGPYSEFMQAVDSNVNIFTSFYTKDGKSYPGYIPIYYNKRSAENTINIYWIVESKITNIIVDISGSAWGDILEFNQVDLKTIGSGGSSAVGKVDPNSNGTGEIFNDYTGGSEATGNYAHAEGDNTTASGHASHAEGQKTQATGYASHAEGGSTEPAYQTHAAGKFAHAEGNRTSAAKDASHSEGYATTANAPCSHVEGNTTTANGEDSHAEGNTTVADGLYAHAEGHNTTARGKAGHAEGNGTKTGECTTFDSEYNSISTSNNNFCHAEGNNTSAGGLASHAEGEGGNAYGRAAHVEGQSGAAIGLASHAEGELTMACGEASHAEGMYTQAGTAILQNDNIEYSGTAAHAEGYKTKALGNHSHAEGYETMATNPNEHAQGIYNVSHEHYLVEKTTSFSIGIGSPGLRKNAIEIMKNGDVYILGIGEYNGSDFESAKTVQAVISELIDKINTLTQA